VRRYGLRDDQWDRIKDILPGRAGHIGVTRAFCRSRALLVSHWLFLAGSAGAVWRFDQDPHATFPLGQERRVEEGIRVFGGRRGQRIRDDRQFATLADLTAFVVLVAGERSPVRRRRSAGLNRCLSQIVQAPDLVDYIPKPREERSACAFDILKAIPSRSASTLRAG
jgi:hypothetical protein